MSEQPPSGWNWAPQGGNQPQPLPPHQQGYPPPQETEPIPYGGYAQQQYPQYQQPPPPPKRSPVRLIAVLAVAAVIAVGAAVLFGVVLNKDDSPGAQGGGGGTGLQAPSVPAGYTLAKSDKDGYALVAPKSFTNFDLTEVDQAKIEESLKDKPKSLNAWNQAKALLSRGLVLFQVDSATGDNLNLLRVSGSGPLPSNIEAQVRPQLEQAGASIESLERVNIGGRESIKVVYTLPEIGEGVHGTQVYVPGSKNVYVLTVTGFKMDQVHIDTIINSLRIT